MVREFFAFKSQFVKRRTTGALSDHMRRDIGLPERRTSTPERRY